MPESLPFHFVNEFHARHAALLCESYERLIGKPLLDRVSEVPARDIFHAPFALVSHGTEADPVFNFANQTALDLFEMSWQQFTALPSRESAEPVNREERARLLARVTAHGYIDDYAGVRISSSGRRFLIEGAVVWNLVDGRGAYHGQAAVFDNWSYL